MPRRSAGSPAIVAGERGGNGQLQPAARRWTGGEAELVLGRDFLVDAELAARIERIDGDRRRSACRSPKRRGLRSFR